jgi:outer membrane protein
MKKYILIKSLSFISIVGASSMLHAQEDYQWQIRGALSNVVPTASSGRIVNNTAEVDIDNAFSVTGTVSYFLNPNIALDLLVGWPPQHDIKVDGKKVGETKHLPPILSLQYHFAPQSVFSPYVGVGVNYTYLFDSRLDSGDTLHLSNSVGAAVQAGFDYRLSPQWSIGADARYADIDTEVKINGTQVGKVDINPVVYSLNLGYRF